MTTTNNGRTVYEQGMRLAVQCQECGRRFDLTNQNDAEEYYYGHDCEA
jgi:ribosomal protein S26